MTQIYTKTQSATFFWYFTFNFILKMQPRSNDQSFKTFVKIPFLHLCIATFIWTRLFFLEIALQKANWIKFKVSLSFWLLYSESDFTNRLRDTSYFGPTWNFVSSPIIFKDFLMFYQISFHHNWNDDHYYL